MKVRLLMTINVDENALEYYRIRYPELAGDERPAETLVREAIAAWDWESLLMPHGEGTTWTEVSVEERTA